MAKRRKGTSRSTAALQPDQISDRKTKLNITSYQDVADSEDEFFDGRDEILLEEGPAQKRKRRLEEKEKFLEASDEEVLELPDDEDDYDDDDEDEEDEEPNNELVNLPRLQQEGDDEGLESASDFNSRDDKEEGWGTSRKSYYDADVIETEADALEEEQEALRLQKKQIEGMKEEYYGFDESEWLQTGKNDTNSTRATRVVAEQLPRLEINENMDIPQRLKLLHSRYPEFQPLASEFLDLQSTVEQLKLESDASRAVIAYADGEDAASTREPPVASLKWAASSAYLGALSMYLILFTSGSPNAKGELTAVSPEELRIHPIMDLLVRCRNNWFKIRDIPTPPLEQRKASALKDVDGSEGNASAPASSTNDKKSNPNPNPNLNRENEKSDKRPKKSRAQRRAEKAEEEARARHVEQLKENLRRNDAQIDRIAQFAKEISSGVSANGRATGASDSKNLAEDSGMSDEPSDLEQDEASAFGRKKRSHRFYASEVVQKAKRRERAGRDAGGDADIPYREKFKERQAKLNAAAEARGRKERDALGTQADSGSGSEEEQTNAEREKNKADDNDDGEDYYDLVAARSRRKKEGKLALTAAKREAAASGGSVRQIDEIGPDGKRAITYAIERNKGLMPKRRKEARNPRVKKRKRFEEKKKKLATTRQVYKGGEGRGGYGGELSGIKTHLVKSVKL